MYYNIKNNIYFLGINTKLKKPQFILNVLYLKIFFLNKIKIEKKKKNVFSYKKLLKNYVK